MLQLSGQLECGNAIIALQAQEDFDSGLQSLRRLSRHWLSAASVLRLLRSDSVKARHARRGCREVSRNLAPPVVKGSILLWTASLRLSQCPSAGSHDIQASNIPPGQVAIDGEQNMDWIHLFASGAAAPGKTTCNFNQTDGRIAFLSGKRSIGVTR